MSSAAWHIHGNSPMSVPTGRTLTRPTLHAAHFFHAFDPGMTTFMPTCRAARHANVESALHKRARKPTAASGTLASRTASLVQHAVLHGCSPRRCTGAAAWRSTGVARAWTPCSTRAGGTRLCPDGGPANVYLNLAAQIPAERPRRERARLPLCRAMAPHTRPQAMWLAMQTTQAVKRQ